MEIVEELQNQLKISPELIKFQEIMEKGEIDRMSELPNFLLVEILSRLPSTKEAIRTGSLSKRWKDLWTSVHTLIFDSSYRNLHKSKFIRSVKKTLSQCRQMKLKKFQLYTTNDIGFESQVNDWIRYAISRDAEEINLTMWLTGNEFPLDQSFFINAYFTHLTLVGCIFNPVGAISWKNLRSLCISYGKLDKEVIENILSGSPQLETLVLSNCSCYRQLDITSESVKKLVLNGLRLMGISEIQAPNVLSLTVEGEMWLGKLMLVNMSSLVEANLENFEPRHRMILYREEIEEMLKGFIINLSHVKELKFGTYGSQVVSRLKAKGFVLPSNVKFPDDFYGDA